MLPLHDLSRTGLSALLGHGSGSWVLPIGAERRSRFWEFDYPIFEMKVCPPVHRRVCVRTYYGSPTPAVGGAADQRPRPVLSLEHPEWCCGGRLAPVKAHEFQGEFS